MAELRCETCSNAGRLTSPRAALCAGQAGQAACPEKPFFALGCDAGTPCSPTGHGSIGSRRNATRASHKPAALPRQAARLVGVAAHDSPLGLRGSRV